jgi:uroporphyrinogen-III decarboxylase
MTSRERLLAAMRGQIPDRVPMPLRMWKFLRKHCGSMNALEDNLKAHEEFGNDIFEYVAESPKPCFAPIGSPWRDDVEVELRQEKLTDRNVWERTIHTPAGELRDVKQALIVPAGSGSGPEIVEPLIKDVRKDIEKYRYMHAAPDRMNVDRALQWDRTIGDRGLAVAAMYSPIDCRDAMKQADFLMLYYDDREAFREIVQIGADAMMAETRRVLEAGMRVIKTWWFFTSPSAGWSPKIYEEMFLPHLVRHVELVHSCDEAIYIYYDDGKMARFADMYVDAGIDVLMTCTPPPMGDADPRQMKARYGKKVCLMGGIEAISEVEHSTPAAIRQMVRDRLVIYKPDGKYIMDGSNSLTYETPAENVRALAEAGREFGVYE